MQQNIDSSVIEYVMLIGPILLVYLFYFKDSHATITRYKYKSNILIHSSFDYVALRPDILYEISRKIKPGIICLVDFLPPIKQ